MEVFDLAAKIALDKKEYDEGMKSASVTANTAAGKIGKALKVIGKATAVAVAAGATAAGALIKQSIQAYSEFEQLAGGTQLMYGDAFDFVMNKARNAYATVQMSQRQYMEQANSFATSFKKSLGGDSQAAAELADRVITAQADIVAATGISQEAAQNAFSGIIRGNYTMLDNLNIGIAGTKTGMEQVIKEVNAWNKAQGKATKYSINNTADVMNALVDYVDMVGLSGYASAEAADTISGSVSSMKAAWDNLVVGMSDDNADMEELVNNFIDSVVKVGENIMPRVETALDGISTLIQVGSEKLVPLVSKAITDNIGSLVSAGAKLLTAIIVGLIQAAPQIVEEIPGIVTEIKNAFIENKDALKDAGMQLLEMLGEGALAAISWAAEVGSKVVDDIKAGIESAWDGLVSWFQGIWDKVFGNLAATVNLRGDYDSGFQHAIGLDYVPYNNYAANLHRGEAVLTRDEAERWRRGGESGGNVTIVQNINETVKTPVEHAAATLAYFEQARWAT